MNKVTQICSVEEFVKLWPRLAKLALIEDPQLVDESLLMLFLRCMETGAVFAVRNDSGLVGSCCVVKDFDRAILYSLPADKNNGAGKACLDAVKTWAQCNGCLDIQVTTFRLCGSSYRYFEKYLGFHRSSVTFLMEVR